MKSGIIGLSIVCTLQGRRPLLLILISGLPEPKRMDREEDGAVSFFIPYKLLHRRGCRKTQE